MQTPCCAAVACGFSVLPHCPTVRLTKRARPLIAAKRSRRSTSVSAAALPPNYGYVLGSVALTAGVIQWMSIRVALARKDSGVKYPAMYADGDDEVAMKFNCTQRAHQNTLENLPTLLGLELVLGQAYPITAAAFGLVWSIGRIVYATGYSTGDPSKRLPGAAISNLAQLAMIVTTLVVGGKAVLAS